MTRVIALAAALAAFLVLAGAAQAQITPGAVELGRSSEPEPEAGTTSAAPKAALVPPLSSVGRNGRSLSAAGWHDGVMQQEWTSDCITGPAILGGSYVGWFGEVGVSPVRNQVYYVRVGWGITANPCTGGAYVHTELQLPSFTQLAISAANPVMCFNKRPSASNLTRFTDGCPQAPTGIGFYGAPSFDPAPGSGVSAWPSAFGSMFEIWVPVKTSQPLSGLIQTGSTGCPSCLYAGTWMIDGVFSPWVFPVQGVYVKQGTPPPAPQPYVDYPTPNNYHYPAGGASDWVTAGFVFTEGTTGNIYTDIRQGTSGPWVARAGPSHVAAGDWRIDQLWGGITPGATVSFRVCYDPDGAAAEVCGASQAFTRPGGADTTAPNTSIGDKPPARTNKTSVTFAFKSTELGSTFLCTFDGAGPTPCTAPTYSALLAGSHTISVAAKDLAGNVDPTPATYTFVVDLTKPNTTLVRTTISGRNATFRFRSNEAGSFQCKLDGGAWKACSSPKTFSGLRAGSHTVRIRAKDKAGNLDPTPVVKTFRIR